MLRSSLGFHTIKLSLEQKEVNKLLRDFKKYSQNTGLIKIFPVDGKEYIDFKLTSDGTSKPIHQKSKNYKITYYQEDRGIEWLIRYSNYSSDFKSYIIEVKINPKILAGIHDYITAATYDNMKTAITNFNLETKKISSVLPSFDYYKLVRTDYCVNFDITELIPTCINCTSMQIMELIKRGDIPTHYTEWMQYDKSAHRTKASSDNLYLKSSSVNINCYCKYMEMQKRSLEREHKHLTPIPQATLNTAHDIIRFEVQCKYSKMYTFSKRAEQLGNKHDNKYNDLLTHESCNSIINDYYFKIVGKGDWYALNEAVHRIESQHFNHQKEKRLIDALYLVNRCRSLAKAKATYKGNDLNAFKRTLKDLYSLNINPVTIPKHWGIKYIPNLLQAYHNKLDQENHNKEIKQFWSESLDKYVEKHGHLPQYA